MTGAAAAALALLLLPPHARAAPATLPGAACAAAGPGAAHTFVALAWDVTCECTDPTWPPQSNGSYCIWRDPTHHLSPRHAARPISG
jgi:hypothetical protein